jgi:hypothetical protein
MTGSPGVGLLRLLEVFDRLEIPYMIGGSGASSVHGLVRTTGDVDLVANLGEHVQELVGELQQDFYIDEAQVRAAPGGRNFVQAAVVPAGRGSFSAAMKRCVRSTWECLTH